MRIVTIGALALCTQLSGCFFFMVPGSVVGKLSDGITGDKGEHCLSRVAKVGDRFRDPNTGRVFTVVSLSGTSMRCTNPEAPIRAELAFEDAPK